MSNLTETEKKRGFPSIRTSLRLRGTSWNFAGTSWERRGTSWNFACPLFFSLLLSFFSLLLSFFSLLLSFFSLTLIPSIFLLSASISGNKNHPRVLFVVSAIKKSLFFANASPCLRNLGLLIRFFLHRSFEGGDCLDTSGENKGDGQGRAVVTC